jgi:K+-sensing histidine kinase KdpD
MQAKPVLGPEGIIEKWVTVSVDIEDRKRAEARDRYLAATTAKLVSSLEHQDLLGEVARLAVPALADVCAIGLFDEANATIRVETAMTDERQRENIERIHLRTWLPAPSAHDVVGDRIMRGEPVFTPDAGEDWVRSCAPSDDQVDAALALGIRSLACLPLMARGSPFGIVTFAVGSSGRTYGEADFRIFAEVASRLSITLENRGLYKSLKETAEELERANAAKDEFLGLISHELKTPLTTMHGNASVLASRKHELEDAARDIALRDIVSESDRLHRIVENLLFLARAEQGQLPEAEPIILKHIVAKTVARHRETHPGRVFEVREQGEPKPVVFHEGYLEQVLENLISNAEKYSPRDRPIVIEIERSSDEVTIKVLDEGIGISSDTDRIFEPFYRSESAVIRAEGLGIGLTVCKRLVEAQGGRMWAQPRAGGGSEFGFALPISSEFEQ